MWRLPAERPSREAHAAELEPWGADWRKVEGLRLGCGDSVRRRRRDGAEARANRLQYVSLERAGIGI